MESPCGKNPKLAAINLKADFSKFIKFQAYKLLNLILIRVFQRMVPDIGLSLFS